LISLGDIVGINERTMILLVFRNAESGSSFIIHLSNAMEKMEIDEDFYSVLTTVNKTVGLTYQPRNNSLQLDNVQMPRYTPFFLPKRAITLER
jgi:hypothetical protein